MRLQNSLLLAVLSFALHPSATAAAVDPVLVGFELGPRTISGDSVVRISAEPIWVRTYTHLQLTYTLGRSISADTPVISLRPGSVGPVTPRAQNPENPFANGSITSVVHGRDLVSDSKLHNLTIDVAPLMKTAQADQLIFTVPRGTTFHLRSLRFLATHDKVPCAAWAHSAPQMSAPRLHTHAPLHCGTASATSLRGNDAIKVDAHGTGYSQLALSLAFFSPALTNYVASKPSASSETSGPALVCVHLRYTDGDDEQFPLSIDTRRHALVNGAPKLYSVPVDPKRTLVSAAIEDRSPHVQLFLYGAALSQTRAPEPVDVPPIPPTSSATRPLETTSGNLFHIANAENSSAAAAPRTQYQAAQSADGEELTLQISNPSEAPLHLSVEFPALTVRSPSGQSLWHCFPQTSRQHQRSARRSLP